VGESLCGSLGPDNGEAGAGGQPPPRAFPKAFTEAFTEAFMEPFMEFFAKAFRKPLSESFYAFFE
jgi:hypothetical protein